jgi:hypothetical protein
MSLPSSNSNTYRLSNEQLLLVNILNTMYNDNLRHINSITETLNSLLDSNNQIRILLTQILNSNQSLNNNSRRNNNTNRRWENNSDRIMINSRPYIIDTINEYIVPRNRRSTASNGSNELFTQILNNFMQPVEIYPTHSQIETATRRVRYCDISRPINTACPISMEDFNDNDMVMVIRHCGHTFYPEQLMNWFRTNCRCPVCRYDIRTYNTGSSAEFFNNSSSRIVDTSNNNIERNVHRNVDRNINRNNNRNTLINENEIFDMTSLDNLLDIPSLLDISGNYTNSTADNVVMFLVNALNRSRSTR